MHCGLSHGEACSTGYLRVAHPWNPSSLGPNPWAQIIRQRCSAARRQGLTPGRGETRKDAPFGMGIKGSQLPTAGVTRTCANPACPDTLPGVYRLVASL